MITSSPMIAVGWMDALVFAEHGQGLVLEAPPPGQEVGQSELLQPPVSSGGDGTDGGGGDVVAEDDGIHV
ncbi:hypothetical protein AB0I99_22155 [Streptomyces spongiicola]|uniref:hypothetical protein n=1 Tax=Streptomyces spongiicola TaxID=1690221 RepID=UPI0033EA89BC